MRNSKIKDLTFVALMAAVLCVLGPLTLPIGAVPISLANLGILLVLYAVGARRGTAAVLLYLLIGTIGLPVFSGFSAGLAKLAGPTGGYLIGYVFMAIIAGLVIDRYWDSPIRSFLGMVAGTALLYLLGTAWLSYAAHMTFAQALAAGVIPFVGIDVLKMILASLLGLSIRRRLLESGLVQYVRPALKAETKS